MEAGRVRARGSAAHFYLTIATYTKPKCQKINKNSNHYQVVQYILKYGLPNIFCWFIFKLFYFLKPKIHFNTYNKRILKYQFLQ